MDIELITTILSAIMIVIWLIASIVSAWFVLKSAIRSRKVLTQMIYDDTVESDLQLTILKQRYERETNIVRMVVVSLAVGAFAGLYAILRPAIHDDFKPLFSVTTSGLLVALQLLLTQASYLLHKHHHTLMNKVGVKLLRAQLEARKMPVKDVTIVKLDEDDLAIAVIENEKEGEQQNGTTSIS